MFQKKIKTILAISMTALMLIGCTKEATSNQVSSNADAQAVADAEDGVTAIEGAVTDDWMSNEQMDVDDKNRTFYEIFLYSYCDSDGDGIGDINGLISKLDYLNDGDPTTTEDLGVTGIWLMPIMPSPSYHKYNTMDYKDIDPEYGTLDDFDKLIEECHKRNINVIIDLAMNHSSSEHPWFKACVEYLQSLPAGATPDASQCPYLDYYTITTESKSGYSKVEGTEFYYESQFNYDMPDLNLQNPDVVAEFEDITEFWLARGVDGFRMDAVKYFVQNAPETNMSILSDFNARVKSVNPEAYIVCECWDSQTEYARYYESGVDSMFDFAFADKDGFISKVMNGKMSAATFGQKLVEADALYAGYAADYINASFYTNHDLGRSAGYYAGDFSTQQTKMGNAINLLMSGNSFLYYGEELGMKGSGRDENKRAPMYWSLDANADGMCDGPADMEDVKMKYDSLEEQSKDADSVYAYVKKAILLRNQIPAIARGQVVVDENVSNETVLLISKEYDGETIHILMNMSAETQEVTVDIKGDGTAATNADVKGQLTTGEEPIVLGDSSVSMPAYSILLW